MDQLDAMLHASSFKASRQLLASPTNLNPPSWMRRISFTENGKQLLYIPHVQITWDVKRFETR
jgi:hypothetical protein